MNKTPFSVNTQHRITNFKTMLLNTCICQSKTDTELRDSNMGLSETLFISVKTGE